MLESLYASIHHFFRKEVEIFSVNKPLDEVYNLIRSNINEKWYRGISIFGFPIDKKIYGKCYPNQIILKQRPPFSKGINYKTTVDFRETSGKSCKVTVTKNSLKYYTNTWWVVGSLLVPFCVHQTFTSDTYNVKINGVSKTVEGHPYWVLLFPIVFALVFIAAYFSIKATKRKVEDFLYALLGEPENGGYLDD